MNLAVLVGVDSAVWAGCSLIVGYGAHRLPSAAVERDGFITARRGWEGDGSVYERLGVRRWKDRLPEAGGLFGGVSKRSLSLGRDGLAQFAAETRRAEYVHWALLAVGPLFAWWNPWPLALAMLGYAVLANVPFVIVQRYNRARVLALAHRKSKRRERSCAS